MGRAGTEPVLPPAAAPAWAAFEALRHTKDAHFDLLREIERREDAGSGRRTLAEIARLADLLEAHTRAVQVFRAALAALARSDADAHAALVAALASGNATLGAGAGGGH